MAASWLASWGTSRSASPMMKTLQPPSTARQTCLLLEQPDARDRMDGHPIGRRVQRLSPTLRHGRGQRVGRFLDLLARLAGLGPGNRHEPVEVWMCQSVTMMTRPTLPARLRAGPLAQEQLSQPQRQALLPDPRGSGEQDHLGQIARPAPFC